MKRINDVFVWTVIVVLIFVSPGVADEIRSAALIVASSTSSEVSKQAADYVCDGIKDEEEINQAIQQFNGTVGYTGIEKTGGWIQLSEGNFYLSSPIVIDRGIRLSGVTGGTTILYLDDHANSHCIEMILNEFNSTIPLSIIEHMEIYGNRYNQTPNIPDLKEVSGTDADPTVLIKNGAFSSFSDGGLAGRKVWIKSGINVVPGTYEIINNDSDSLTLHKNASNGMPILNAEIRIEGIAGIYVDSIWQKENNNGQVDVRFFDIWFDSINGPCVSIGNFWNHKFGQCTFEHISGPAVELRCQGSSVSPTDTQIYDSFAIDVENITRMFGVGRARGICVHDCRFNQISKTVFEIPGEFFHCHDCKINLNLDANNTYNVFEINTTHRNFSCHHIKIDNNFIDYNNTNDPARFFYSEGTSAISNLYITGNAMYSTTRGPQTNFAAWNNGARCDFVNICDNHARSFAANTMIDAGTNGGYKWFIHNNLLAAASGGYEIEITDACDYFTITDNHFTRGLNIVSTDTNYPPLIKNNKGYVTEASGSASFSNATSAVINHGLSITPSIVICTPTADPADDIWISDIGATQFTINVGTNYTGDIMWIAKKEW